MIDTFLLEHETTALCAEMHAQAIAENAKESVYCRFTGRKLGEIGEKPRGFDPSEMPDFDAESQQSQAIGEDARQALHLMRLCGRGVSRSSAEIWADEDWKQKRKKGGTIPALFSYLAPNHFTYARIFFHLGFDFVFFSFNVFTLPKESANRHGSENRF